MDIENLLREVQNIQNKYNFYEQKSGANFNIFRVLNVAENEVSICRILYELLNPQGSHGQGNLYLKLFAEKVLRLPGENFEKASVYREYTLSSKRRIDIVIKSGEWFIPIEVKIYADDQYEQCYDYYQAAQAPETEKSYMYYLTLDGHIPSPESARGLTEKKDGTGIVEGYDEVICLSFASDMLTWLRACLSARETQNIDILRCSIVQLIGVVEMMTDQSNNPKDKEIMALIGVSAANMKSTIQICQYRKRVQTELLCRVFSNLEKCMKESNKLVIQDDIFYFDNPKTRKADTYYERKGTYPGLSYQCRNIKDDVDLWFRIEISDTLFFGFCTPKNNEWAGRQLTADEAKEMLGIDVTSSGKDNWWLNQVYVEEDGNPFNFRECNDNYFRLYDAEYFKSFIIKCYEQMKAFTDLYAEKTGFKLVKGNRGA